MEACLVGFCLLMRWMAWGIKTMVMAVVSTAGEISVEEISKTL